MHIAMHSARAPPRACTLAAFACNGAYSDPATAAATAPAASAEPRDRCIPRAGTSGIGIPTPEDQVDPLARRERKMLGVESAIALSPDRLVEESARGTHKDGEACLTHKSVARDREREKEKDKERGREDLRGQGGRKRGEWWKGEKGEEERIEYERAVPTPILPGRFVQLARLWVEVGSQRLALASV